MLKAHLKHRTEKKYNNIKNVIFRFYPNATKTHDYKIYEKIQGEWSTEIKTHE